MKSLIDIADETARARELHGYGFERADDVVKLCVLHEETGEVARAIQDLRRAYAMQRPEAECEALRAHLRAELVQVASLAIRWIDQMDGVDQ